MRALLARPGWLGSNDGGQELRDLYGQQSASFAAELLNDFALSCFSGSLGNVAIRSGNAPPLNRKETPFEFGYVTWVVAGSQRLTHAPHGMRMWADVLKVLLQSGAPVNSEDICGYTALHHAALHPRTPTELLRILLEHGANVNHQNKYGITAIVAALMAGHCGAVDVLMEFGADLTIPDADDDVPLKNFVQYGPQTTAVVTKWLRKRAGEQAPLDEKKCGFCSKADGGNVKLKACAACRSVRYCSTACQRSHWKTHKLTCQPFNAENTVTLKPIYKEYRTMMSTADLTRNILGITPPQPERPSRGTQRPISYPKSVIIKVQVPFAGTSPLLVYEKKRDFVCEVKRADCPQDYDRIMQVIREKGVGGLKGYFAAELRSKDELVVKVGEILAEQPF
ncbi:hypothetical protein EWM64_g638 [Hericium alpestre]|uniref:MYND-type domain-containing protein n=1 Tax=Hericium alpestre TaxID=135208 RepID=A0A4Z0AAK8_9AGAM|nr:hypothetical protein EWM64_g638 [Hericium alpestre]